MKVAVVGATGLVGSKMLQVLAERNFPVTELIPVASERSIGKKVMFKDKEYPVVSYQDAIAAKPDVAIFSAGGSTSLELAPKFAEAGITVIDNSSAWRMDPTKKLVVPEVNANVLTKEDKIIANPNCSTIQMVIVLKPLHEKYKIKRVVVSTYQSVTGTGVKAVDQNQSQRVENNKSHNADQHGHEACAAIQARKPGTANGGRAQCLSFRHNMYPLGASAFLARSYSKFKSGVANNNSSHVPRHSKLSSAHSDACNDPY